jgi:hypothetical protein
MRLKGVWAEQHSLGKPKNLCGAHKYGARTELALRPCFASIELGLVSIWTACVRGPQGNGVPGTNRA